MSSCPPRRSPLVVLSILAFCLLGCGGGGGGSGTAGPGSGTDARLGSLALSVGTLGPAFDTSTTNYAAFVESAIPSTTVFPTAVDPASGVTVNGGPPGVAIALAPLFTRIDVVVTAPDGVTTSIYTVMVTRFQSHDLVDPTPGVDDRFGSSVVVLENGNIAVSDPRDRSVGVQTGAVHLYSPLSSMPLASIHGDLPGDRLGSGGITALGNSNFVVLSPIDDEGGVVNAGSVRLVSGTTGAQIGATLMGDVTDDLEFTTITALGNGNFVVVSSRDDVGGLVDAGSVRLISGTTGAQIGAALTGDVASDVMGSGRVTALGNSNFVVVSNFDDEGGVVDAGSVRLLSGTTGAQFGSTLAGDVTGDLGFSRIVELGNGNFVVAMTSDDEGGVVDAGSVRLFNGTTGAQIGAALVGDTAGDRLGNSDVTALGNNNYVVASGNDDEGGVVDAGSVRLVSGTTGAQIGTALAGDDAGDQLAPGGVAALGNSNFVSSSRLDDVGGVVDAGSVRLVSGTTGVQIGATLSGDATDDKLGTSSATALGNNNYVVSAATDDVGGVVDAGSVRLVSGTTGAQIGVSLAGDSMGDRLGSSDKRALGNNNFFVSSPDDDVGGVVDAGSVRLVSGTTGAQIGPSLAGDLAGDQLGGDFLVALTSNKCVVVSCSDDEGGVVDAGSVRLLSGATGAQIGVTLAGNTTDDEVGTAVIAPSHGAFFVVAFPRWDNGSVDSGRVRLIAE